MKRTVLFFTAFLFFVFSIAFAETDKEITFSNISWLSDDSITMQALSDGGYIRDGVKLDTFTSDNPFYLVVDETGFISPDRISGVEESTFVANLAGRAKGKIAGYPVNNIVLTFAYDGSYQLIAVNIDLLKADYNDLKSKLTKVYGEGEHMATDNGIDSIVWKGSSNSAVVLYTQNEGLNYQFVYGRLDAVEILTNCSAKPADDDLAGL